MFNLISPKVTLVGAGPGDPDLISIKGAKALNDADFVLYDALVHPDLLLHAKKAHTLFVGKRKGKHQYSQEKINQLLVEKAFKHGNVVRLKGGDPFIFGRGAEEISYLKQFNIETVVIPGISSATSVPARLGISLTHRGISESFWTITGTRSDRQLSKDIELAVQSSATVVFLMGMHNLPKIVSHYINEGKNETPIAIIQNGYMPNEKSVVGTINTILPLVDERKISNPAIIVIGEVVRHANSLSRIHQCVNHGETFESNLFANLNI